MKLTKKRCSHCHVGVNILFDPLSTPLLLLDKIEKKLNNSVAHAMAYENHGRFVLVNQDLDCFLQFREVPCSCEENGRIVAVPVPLFQIEERKAPTFESIDFDNQLLVGHGS